MSWIVAFLGFAFLILAHEFLGHALAAKLVGVKVERATLFFPPYIWRKQVGETEVALGSVPLGGLCKLAGFSEEEAKALPEEDQPRAYYNQPVWKRFVIIFAGPLVNILLAFILMLLFFSAIGVSTVTNTIGALETSSPAAQAGLKLGDKIVAIDGKKADPEKNHLYLAEHTCAVLKPNCLGTPATLTVQPKGQTATKTITVRPKYDANPDIKRMRLGFSYAKDGPRETIPVGEASSYTIKQFWVVTRETIKLPLHIFNEDKRKELSSVVGGYEITRQTFLDNAANTVAVLAVISLSLGLINLFPVLPLDGGHITTLIYEKIFRRRMNIRTMEKYSYIGFILIMILFGIGLTNDIGRIMGEGFMVR